jgi:hypothetical protein
MPSLRFTLKHFGVRADHYTEGYKRPFMGSVASTNSGLSDLLQTLSNDNSPLLSTLTSPAVEAALEKAPPGDIAQISKEAQQLQIADAIFGDAGTSTSGSSASTSAASLAEQLAAYQSNSQIQDAQTLLGISPSTTTPNSQFDVFA